MYLTRYHFCFNEFQCKIKDVWYCLRKKKQQSNYQEVSVQTALNFYVSNNLETALFAVDLASCSNRCFPPQ